MKKKIDCLFFIDEAYYDFGSETALSLIKKFSNVIVARTFSKGFGVPSIRLGYLISNKENLEVLSKPRFAHESNSLSITVGEYLIDNYEIVREYNNKVIESREKIKTELEKIWIKSFGNYGNYLLLDLKTKDNALKIVTKLREEKIYVKGPWGGKFSQYVTISIGPFDIMQKFINCLKKIIKDN